jgi:8-oxo-dGTP pyrophosphatase MutT (NUDIX family)
MQFFIIALVFNQKNQILVVKKEIPRSFLELCGIDYNPGQIWFAPSGNQVKGETREEAAERIVLQETGYKVKGRWEIPKTLVSHFSKVHGSFFKIVVVCELLDNKIDPNFKKPDYIEDIRWFNKEELLKNTLPEISSKWPETLKKVLVVSN